MGIFWGVAKISNIFFFWGGGGMFVIPDIFGEFRGDLSELFILKNVRTSNIFKITQHAEMMVAYVENCQNN